jgi:hypothetical protein
MDKLSVAATITAKDKLMEAISEITSEIEPNTALKTIIGIKFEKSLYTKKSIFRFKRYF